MTLLEAGTIAVSCLLVPQTVPMCLQMSAAPAREHVTRQEQPFFSGEAVDVVLTAESALVWDLQSGATLYERHPYDRRPVASLSKLFSALVIRDALSPETIIPIPPEVRHAQAAGAHIRLPAGEHATVTQLLAAALIHSANDAMVALAIAVSDSETAFAERANEYVASEGMTETRLSNSTGLSGGIQYSTAADVRRALTRAYDDALLRDYLAAATGTITTLEGTRRQYRTTNELLKTYVPIAAAKTGYTIEAGENLAIITTGSGGQQIGAIILGSENRFQDMKILVEWIWRNYTWHDSIF